MTLTGSIVALGIAVVVAGIVIGRAIVRSRPQPPKPPTHYLCEEYEEYGYIRGGTGWNR